jgi:hypothetical protein
MTARGVYRTTRPIVKKISIHILFVEKFFLSLARYSEWVTWRCGIIHY